MAPRRRRATRKLDDLPGLFDEIDLNITSPEAHSTGKRPDATDGNAAQIDLNLNPTAIKRRNELEFISFGSGSSGNCAYLGIKGRGGILIDAGIDAQKVQKEMAANGLSYDNVVGILLTHDHADHIRAAYQLVRKRNHVRIYCTPRVMQGIMQRHNLSRRLRDYHQSIYKEIGFKVGPFEVVAFETSHDGSDNVGFCISIEGKNFVIATDMGIITERADHYIRLANFLMIESNYDAHMLDTGAYPEYLKARIRSAKGHLDNAVTSAYLAQIWAKSLTDIYLCHLSHDNNTPAIALSATTTALQGAGATVGDASGSFTSRNADVRVYALPRFDTTPLFIHRL